jgi:hypothetical protein
MRYLETHAHELLHLLPLHTRLELSLLSGRQSHSVDSLASYDGVSLRRETLTHPSRQYLKLELKVI